MSERKIDIIHTRKIFKLLELISSKHYLYLTSKSITALQNFLSGYLCIMDEDFDMDFHNFKYWFLNKNPAGNVVFPYHKALLEECAGNEEKAFERFFEYLEEYKKTL